MKDKSYGAILQFAEALQLTTELGLKVYPPSFSIDGGIFDGWVHVWEFVRQNERGVNVEWHYFFTDAFNIFNFDQKEDKHGIQGNTDTQEGQTEG